MDEYEQVQRLREMWSRPIMIWGQVLLPVGVAVAGFFVRESLVRTGGWDFGLLLAGWFLLLICMGYWRWVVHHLDEKVVGLYPTMLRLERKDRRDTQTRYYFSNLAKRSRKHIRHQLGLERMPNGYEDFVEGAKQQNVDHYGLLLDVWHDYGRNSVTDRGHRSQDIAVSVVMVGTLAGILSLVIGAWAVAALLLFLVILPWGRHRGWWLV